MSPSIGSSPVGGFEAQGKEFVDKIVKAGCTLKTTENVLPKPSLPAAAAVEASYIATWWSIWKQVVETLEL